MTTAIRNRVVGLRYVRASDLVPNARNWRLHPERQSGALRALLDEVGFVGAVIARELPDGRLELIDGHLRRETAPDAELPVLVVDLDDAEAAKVLENRDDRPKGIGARCAIAMERQSPRRSRRRWTLRFPTWRRGKA